MSVSRYVSPEKKREYNQREYKKCRSNKKKWQYILASQRERFRRVGHKKFPSTCIVCGKQWLGIMKVRRFCSQKCVSHGVHNGRWNGGRFINSKGYVMVYCPTHPLRISRSYIKEHRLVMEKNIGRFLSPKEDVHHRNGIKSDNRIENLKLMSKSEHTKLHWRQIKRRGHGGPLGRHA